jgi:hypothetical protein
MRKVILTIGLFILCTAAKAQIEGTSLPSLPSLTTGEMNGATGVYIGSSVFNTDDQKVYRFTSSGWVTSTDDQNAGEVTIADTAGNFAATDVEGALVELAAASTDEQALSLAASNILSLEDGGTVNLTPFLDNTDSQNLSIGTGGVANESIEVAISGGTNALVDIRDGDSVIGNESVTNLSFDGTTLTLTQDGAPNEAVNLSSVSTSNIYNTNGTLTGARTINGATNSLIFNNLNALQFSATTFQTFAIGAIQIQTTSGAVQISGPSGIALQSNTTVEQNLIVNGDARVENLPAAGDTDQLVTADTNGNLRKVNSLKASKVFYPPSIAIDASAVVNNQTVDLYQEYLNQFGGTAPNFMASAGAPATVPTYSRTELYYYVTFADPLVLHIDNINASGVLLYDVVGTPLDYNSLINVVFVVK